MATFLLEKGEFHEHSPNEDVSLILKDGQATVEFSRQKIELGKGDSVTIPKGISFKIETISETPCLVKTASI
jgi:mannose-6-phosphate isomerase-like protein (cupin superfamily)